MRSTSVALGAVAAVLWGCGSDASGPASPPDIAGLYDVVSVIGPSTCAPPDTAGVLSGVLLGVVDTVHFGMHLDQNGESITLTVITVEGSPLSNPIALPATVDVKGVFHLAWVTDSDQVTMHYASSPDRLFYVRTTAQASGPFDMRSNPAHGTVTGGTVQEFREGSTGAPLFATCTSPETDAFTRVGA
jgi:hypothetical protein